jgi:hypothetical protein
MYGSKKQNYFKSEAIGFIVSHACATATTLLMEYAGMSHEIIVLSTFAAKTFGFAAGKILAYKSDTALLVRSISVTGSLESIAQLAGHYLLLKYDVMPNYYAYPVAYSIPGILATGFRWYMDYKAGIISNGNKPLHNAKAPR